MSAGKSVAKWFSARKLSPAVASVLIAIAGFACALAIQRAGLLQFLEFQSYDFFIRNQPKAANSEPVVIVEMTESDIHNPTLDYPIHDDKLAELLLLLEADEPAAIGVDIWRDLPVPKSGEGIKKLNEVLLSHGNIVAIFTLGVDSLRIAPPAALGLDPGRVGFNDNFPADVNVDNTIPKVRRTHLSGTTTSGETFLSLPFWLAVQLLEKKGIEVKEEEDGNRLRLGKTTLRRFRGSDGAYVRADDNGWDMLMDFRCPDEFTRFTMTEALAGRIPKGALRDKIVIVGINTASVEDERVTPIRHDHRGIEVQGAAVNQLLRMALDGERPMRVWSNWIEDLWMLIWCLAGGAIGYRVHSPLRFAVESVACLIAIFAAAWLLFSRGWWIPAVSPAIGYAFSSILVTTYTISQERSMRAILMKLYSRHVSKEIAESVWAQRESFLEGHRPLAQKLVVTVLFTDLKGFSTISEKMAPPELYGWLNDYLGAMAQVVHAHGGTLKQFTGDGILVLFGVPVPHTPAEQANDATAAVKCALAMGRRLIELIPKWKEAGLPQVSMRAGIYTGEVAAGSIGSDERFEYAVIGDVVNTASRLESYDKSLENPDLLPNRCRILIGEPTYRLLNGDFASREIGLLEVKGKANKVPVFIILDEQAGAPTSAAS